ncbi:hypothetical protein T439DRAFT_378071 [Meredithblackwellia eburnea MCA 4105]
MSYNLSSSGINGESVIPALRESCHDLRIASNIKINEAQIDKFILEMNRAEWEKDAGSNKHGIRLPLRFDSHEEELNLIAILSILNFLSAYRTPLHRLTGRGAWSTILSLVLAAHLSSTDDSASPLTTEGMLKSTPATLAPLAQIQLYNEKAHPTLGPAVKVGEKDNEAWEILELVAGVLTETGQVLKTLGKRDLGQWVKDELIKTEGNEGEMLVKLATTFPAFCDAYTIDGKQVYILKKALFLLNAIALRFGPSSSDDTPSFPIPSVDNLPVFADNVIPTMLVHFQLLDLSSSTDPVLLAGLVPSTPQLTNSETEATEVPSSSTPTPGVSLSASSAARLRASAVDVCAFIVKRAKELAPTDGEKTAWLKDWNEVDLDGYLWSVAKNKGLRDVPRVVELGTVFY